jgi:hypothetical protein
MFGLSLRAHALAPPIYFFPYGWQRLYLITATDQDVESLLLILKTGTKEEQQIKIHSIIEERQRQLSDNGRE